eukprot:3831415-Ditylum_brightwellii.AAC.1
MRMRNIVGRNEERIGQLGSKWGSQRIVDFSEKGEDWHKEKDGTWCALDGSGDGRIPSDRGYTDRRKNQNRKVFSNVSHANSGKSVYHLERQQDDKKDGYVARNSSN